MSKTEDRTTANPAEIEKFSALADTWWDASGPFKPLHKFNPSRLTTLIRSAGEHFGRDPSANRPFQGLTAVDVGCGGGLVSEPLANVGFEVLGIDASAKNIGIATAHASKSGAASVYAQSTPEDLAAQDKTYDLVVALEIIEHVDNVDAFYQSVCQLVAPGGLLVLATLNRTAKSLLMAKIGAEYVLRWLPIGTHDWRKFLKPSEIATGLRANGFAPTAVRGFTFNPLTDLWREGDDTSVNYMVIAKQV